jgi:acyl-CoA hydrolase
LKRRIPAPAIGATYSGAYSTFVALDEEGCPTEVPALGCQTPEEKRRFEEGKRRREQRIRWREELKKK